MLDFPEACLDKKELDRAQPNDQLGLYLSRIDPLLEAAIQDRKYLEGLIAKVGPDAKTYYCSHARVSKDPIMTATQGQ